MQLHSLLVLLFFLSPPSVGGNCFLYISEPPSPPAFAAIIWFHSMGLLRGWLCWKLQKWRCQLETRVEPLHFLFHLRSTNFFFRLQLFASHNMKAVKWCHPLQYSMSSENKWYAEEILIHVTNECNFVIYMQEQHFACKCTWLQPTVNIHYSIKWISKLPI